MKRSILKSFTTLLLACLGTARSEAATTKPVEVACGVVYSLSAPSLYGSWTSTIPQRMGGAEWNRMIHLLYSPYVALKNTTNRPVVLATTPTIYFNQPPLNLKFTRIASTMAGSITSQSVPLNWMYVSSNFEKTFTMTLYSEVVNGVGSGKLSIPAGGTRILTPDFNQTTTLASRYDWQNHLTGDIKASPGWKGTANGFSVSWLSGRSSTSFNGGLGVFATRSTDSWDVECNFLGPKGNWRIFKLLPDQSPLETPDTNREITTFPFNLGNIRSTVSTASMAVDLFQPAYLQPISGMFSVLGRPDFQSTLAVLSDSDSNGLPDEWEFQAFNQLGVSPTADADGDGLSNLFEYVSGHSPVNSGEKFVQQCSKQESGNLVLTWSSLPGRSYGIERSDNLASWTPVATVSAAASPAVSTSFDLGPPSSSAAYFRIRLSVAP